MAVSTDRATALMPVADIDQAGAVFNDATRLLDGGLWSTPNDSNNQENYATMVTGDLNVVAMDLQQAAAANANLLADPNFMKISADLTAELAAIPNATSMNAHTSGVADTTLHTAQLDIINIANTDALFAGLAQALPVGSVPDGQAANPTTPHATLADIGQIFNSAADLAVGGLSDPATLAKFAQDLNVVQTGLNGILNDPAALATTTQGDATSILHLQTVADQVSLQLNNFDHQYGHNPDAGRSTNDNLLDIIDIVQGDQNLAAAANAGGANGFGNFPDYLTGTINHFQDDQAQTNFWSNFIVGGNQIAADAAAYAANPTAAGATALTNEVNAYHQFTSNFDMAQGGIFQARFDNELAANGSTVAADSAAILDGIKTNNTAEINAAAAGFQANESDVSGNNTPVGGGSYVNTATTLAASTTLGNQTTAGPGNPGTNLGGHGNGAGADAGADASSGHDASHTVDYSHIWHHA
jgi:trimeric autotransporter adhesin